MSKSAAAEVDPVNNYFGGGSRRAAQLAQAVPALKGKASAPPSASEGKGSFRAFLAQRQPEGAKVVPLKAQKPTKQRLEKADHPAKTSAGFYRAPAPIERLRDQRKLDEAVHINAAMYEAAQKLAGHFYDAGLTGIQAQDLSSCVGGGGDGAACGFPKSERAMHNRQKVREACKMMGWFEAHPYKGAGRLVVDVVCYEMTIADASRIHIPGCSTAAQVGAGMDRLRTGLFMLAVHWKLF